MNRAKNQVMAERANLIAQEQTSFINTVIAYVGPAIPLSASQVQVGVIETQQLLALAINNEQVLAKQLQATNDRFRVGEITRTDVAQAEAALAQATAQRQTAEGNLETARGTFQQVVGFLPPGDLVAPQPLALPVKTERDATIMAANNNPTVIAALFNDAAAKDAIDVAFAQLMPQVSFQGQVFQSNNAAARSSQANGYQAIVQLSVPVYQGGAEYSAVRQARQSCAADHAAGGRRAPHRGAECRAGVGATGGGQGLGRQHTGGDPRQRDRARRRGARGHRRQPHHARRAECAADPAEFAGHTGAEPRADCDRFVSGRRRRSGA